MRTPRSDRKNGRSKSLSIPDPTSIAEPWTTSAWRVRRGIPRRFPNRNRRDGRIRVARDTDFPAHRNGWSPKVSRSRPWACVAPVL